MQHSQFAVLSLDTIRFSPFLNNLNQDLQRHKKKNKRATTDGHFTLNTAEGDPPLAVRNVAKCEVRQQDILHMPLYNHGVEDQGEETEVEVYS